MDYNATTPLEPDVIQAISEALQDAWGNPSSSYIAGEENLNLHQFNWIDVAIWITNAKQVVCLNEFTNAAYP